MSRKSTLSLKSRKSAALKNQVNALAPAEDGVRDRTDCEERRVVFSMYEAASLTLAQVKLEVDFENILKL